MIKIGKIKATKLFLVAAFGLTVLNTGWNFNVLAKTNLISEEIQKSKYVDLKSGKFNERVRGQESKLSENDEEIKKEAQKLYDAIVKFVQEDDAKGYPAEGFENRILHYLMSGSTDAGVAPMKMKKVSHEEFAKTMEKQPENYRILYRGEPKKEYVDSLINGEPFFGKGAIYYLCDFRKHDYDYCSYAMHTATSLEIAKYYNECREDFINEKNCLKHSVFNNDGGVVKLAIDLKKSKFIENEKLGKIIITMLYLHPEMCDKYELFNSMIPGHLRYSSAFKQYSQAFKETYGFDVSDIRQKFEDELVKNGCCTAEELEKVHADKNFTDLERDLSYRVREVLEEKIFKDEKFRSKFDELMSKEETKVHLTNKLYYAYHVEGLAARLLGYDAIAEAYGPDPSTRTPDIYRIVDPKNLIVCDYLIKQEPQTLHDVIKETLKNFNVKK